MNNSLILLFAILLFGVIGSLSGNTLGLAALKEGYSSFKLNDAGPTTDISNRLLNEYPSTNSKTVSDNNYNNIWWKYPIFKVGSFTQITNNLRYRRNPDDGECTTAEFCGALYKDSQVTNNIINPLPPVSNASGTRINYYRTPNDLFLGKQPGALLELPAF